MKQVLIAASLILMIFFFDKLHANGPNQVYWEEKTLLSIEDFQLKNEPYAIDKIVSPISTVSPAVIIFPQLNICPNEKNKLAPHIKTVFQPEVSWIKIKNSSSKEIEESLAYANLKFLITEVFSRKLRRRIAGANFTCSEKEIFYAIFNEFNERLKQEIISLNDNFPTKNISLFLKDKINAYTEKLYKLHKFSSTYKQNLSKQEILWSTDLDITWDDYQAPPPHANYTKADAITSSVIVFKHNCSILNSPESQKDIAKIQAYSVFLPHQSWIRENIPGDPKYQHVLYHEKIHFDITELYTRKLKQRLSQKVFTCEDVDEFNHIYDEVFFQLLEAQTNYDIDTGSSMHELEHPGLHEKIHNEIKDQIRELDAFAM